MRARLIWILLWLAGCAPSPTPHNWRIFTLGKAPILDAPAAHLPARDDPIAAWIAPQDGGGRFHFWQGDAQNATLPVPSRHARAAQIFAGIGGRYHLLWLDQDENGQTRLYSLLANREPRVELGPPVLSTARTEDFAALTDEMGGLWVLWTGGALAEPDLFQQHIDPLGRPGFPTRVAQNAVFIAAARSDVAWAYWLDNQNIIWRARFDADTFDSPTRLARAPTLSRGDRLVEFYAAHDATRAYLFGNIQRASGEYEAWFATATDHWAWAPLLVNGEPIRWAAPAATGNTDLPVAAASDSAIFLLHLRGTTINSQQTIAQTEAARLYLYDDERQYLLTWAMWDGRLMAALSPSDEIPPDTR